MKLPSFLTPKLTQKTAEAVAHVYPKVIFEDRLVVYAQRPDIEMKSLGRVALLSLAEQPSFVVTFESVLDGGGRYRLSTGAAEDYEYAAPDLPSTSNYKMVVEHEIYQALKAMLTQRTDGAVAVNAAPGFGRRWKVATVAALLMSLMAIYATPRMDNGAEARAVHSAAGTDNGREASVAAAHDSQVATGDRQLVGQELSTLAAIVSQSGISIKANGGDPFILFSDPNCPACRALDDVMREDKYKFAPLFVPVAYKEGSLQAVASVLCAPDVGAAWLDAIAGRPLGPACPAGLEQAKKNNAAFEALHFSSTPTLVSAGGKVAQGSRSYTATLDWVARNAMDVHQAKKVGS